MHRFQSGLKRRSSKMVMRSFLVLFCAATAGCSGALKGVLLTEGAPPSNSVKTVLVLPMNFDITPTPILEPGVELLEEEFHSRLADAGFEVSTLRLSQVKRTWLAVVRKLTGRILLPQQKFAGPKYEASRRTLAKFLLEENPADIVAMPTLVVREGRYRGMDLVWDGVRSPPVVDSSAGKASTAFMKGTDIATSFRVSLFDKTGKLFFERHAGLETIMKYTMNDAYYLEDFSMKESFRDDLFQDQVILTEAVKMALEPWYISAASDAVN